MWRNPSRIPGFSYGGWMTVLTYITFIFCAISERVLTNDNKRNSSVKVGRHGIDKHSSPAFSPVPSHPSDTLTAAGQDYALVSLLTMSGLYLTNMSLNYLDYATRVIFKSSKVIPVMIFGVVVQRRKYSWQQYCAGVLLVAGISTFTLGDKAMSPSFSLIGVMLITLALVCDALTSNLEEKLFFRKDKPSSEPEVILYTSLFGSVGSMLVTVLTGELSPAVAHSSVYVETVPYICGFSVLGYLSVTFILKLIQHFDATSTEIVKSMRKVLQVVMSFVIYAKPLNTKIMVGGLFVTLSILWFQQCSSKGKKAAHTPQEPTMASETEQMLPVKATATSQHGKDVLSPRNRSEHSEA
jgi:adenosine 3'-phospho 5'-phosphosulfate transporter B3